VVLKVIMSGGRGHVRSKKTLMMPMLSMTMKHTKSGATDRKELQQQQQEEEEEGEEEGEELLLQQQHHQKQMEEEEEEEEEVLQHQQRRRHRLEQQHLLNRNSNIYGCNGT